MRRVGAAVLLMALCSWSGEAIAKPPPAPPHGITGEDSSGTVAITGTSDRAGRNGVNRGSTSSPAPVGATQLVACGSNAATELTGLGDPTASDDAGSCASAIFQCRQAAPGATSASIRVQKQANGTWTLNGSVCTKPAKPVVTAQMVRDRVVRLIPTAPLGLAPHDTSLINIQTIMWVDAPATQTLPPVSILGQNVTVTLNLDHVDWDFGDHQNTSTRTAGKVYDNIHDPCRTATCPDYFGHTYRSPGSTTIHATATWTASFTVAGQRAATIPGTVAGPTATTTLTVKQARSVLVPNPGEH